MDATIQEKPCPNCGGNGYLGNGTQSGPAAQPCGICDGLGTLPPYAPLYQAALEARAERLKLRDRATAKRGDLERHDAQARKLCAIAMERITQAGEILFREGPLSPDLKLAVLDAQTVLGVLAEVLL